MRILSFFLCIIPSIFISQSDSFHNTPSSIGIIELRGQSSLRVINEDLLETFDDDSSFFSYQEDDDDRILKYLPIKEEMTLRAEEVITQATRRHIYGDTRNDRHLNVTDVLQVIEDEYKCSDVPIRVGKRTVRAGVDVEHKGLSRILSFAAYHRLPKEITRHLFGEDNALSKCREEFNKLSDWSSVSFPRGLAIRPPRERLHSPFDRFNPIPRPWKRKLNIRMAEQAVVEAAQTKAPPRRLSRQEFIKLGREARAKTMQKVLQLQDLFPFFPTKENFLSLARKNLSRFVNNFAIVMGFAQKVVSRRLKTTVKACLLSAALLAFSFYTYSIISHWQQLSATFCAGSSAIRSSMMRFNAILSKAYSVGRGSSLILPALGFAPIANQALKNLSKRLREKSDTIVLIRITTLLAIFHVGIAAALFFLDAAMLKSVYNLALN